LSLTLSIFDALVISSVAEMVQGKSHRVIKANRKG